MSASDVWVSCVAALLLLVTVWLFIACYRLAAFNRKLKGSNHLFEKSFPLDKVKDAFFTIDAQSRLISANQVAKKLFLKFHAKEASMGSSLSELLPVPQQHRLRDILSVVKAEGHTQIETTVVQQDGQMAYLEVDIHSILEKNVYRGAVFHIRDISRRKTAEAKIKQSEETNRILFEQNPSPLILTDLKSLRICGANKAAEIEYGYTQEELLNLQYIELLAPCEKNDEYISNLQTDNIIRGQYLHRSKSGVKMSVEVQSHVLKLPGRNIRLDTIKNLTTEKAVHDALLDSEKRFATFMDNSPATVWIKNWDGSYIYVNKKYEEQFNIALDQIKGWKDEDLLPTSIASSIARNDNEVIAEGKPLEIQQSVPTPDGVMRHWMTYKFPLYGKSGTPWIGGIAIDVTDKREAENALEESERLYRLISENTLDLICLHDNEGKFTYLSPSVEEILGYSATELNGSRPQDLIHPEDLKKLAKADRPGLCTFATGSPVHYRIKRRNGDYIWMETICTQFKNTGRKEEIWQTVSRNINERKQAEEELGKHMSKLEAINGELIKAKELAERSVKIKEEFLANTSHEIRNPVNAIIGLTKLLLGTPLDTEQRNYLRSLESSGNMLMVVLNDILDLSKIEAGKMSFEAINFDLREIIYYLVELMKPKALEKKLDLTYEIDPTIATTLVGDPTRLNQIIMNLLSNAIKFTHEGQVHIAISCAENNNEKQKLHFQVKDTGIGIAADKLDTIFQSFTQANSSTVREYGGTGLGLTIVKRLVELQGGAIYLKSQLNKGSTFGFELEYSVQGALPADTLDEADRKTRLNGIKVLLAEDDAINRLLAGQVLSDFGIDLTMAEDGGQAIKLIKENEYQIILLDLQMPVKTGVEVAKYIRQEMPDPHCHTPILALTAHVMKEEIAKCLQAGMNDYIIKPFDPNLLYRKLSRLIMNNNLEQMYIQTQEKNTHQIINLDYLYHLSEGNKGFVEQMLNLFVTSVPGALSEMEDCLEKKEWLKLSTSAHKLKPSFGVVGIREAEELLKKIEISAKELPNGRKISLALEETREMAMRGIEEIKKEMEKL